MKKLMVLMLVLAISPLASAVVTISLEGEGTSILATPGTTVRINIDADGLLIAMDALLGVSGGDIISGAMSKADAASYGWDPGLSFDPLGLGTASVEIGGGTFGDSTIGTTGYIDIAFTGGTQLVSLSAGQSFGGSMDTGFGVPTFSQGVVTIVPEPMTLALLGLGGLFLRRRKK